jgi:hypothetical protein
MTTRHDLLTRTLVQLADSLVDDFDVVELLTLLAGRCVDVLGVTAAGLMLVAPEGDLRVMASSSEAVRLLELYELQAQEGPCFDCYQTGERQLSPDLTTERERWPQFAPFALDSGFRSAHAFPMHLRGDTLGAVNLFGAEVGAMDDTDVLAAQALSDVATIAILQHRAIIEAHLVNEQLHHALNTRIVIEQAKGMLAERTGDSVEQAFTRLRSYARNNNLLLAAVAQRVIDGDLPTRSLPRPPPPRRRGAPG